MFDILTDAIENGLDVVEGLAYGETPTKRQVAQLISDGITVAAIAEGTGLAIEIIEGLSE